MKKTSTWLVIASFLKEKAGAFFLYVVTASLFLLVGSLSHLDMEPLWYALMLSGIFLLISALVSISHHAVRCRQAQAGHQHLETLPAGLPAPQTQIESIYLSLIEQQGQLRLREKNEQTKRMKEREDYYTLWMHQIKTPISAMRLLLQSSETPLGSQWEEELFKTERYAEMALQYLRISNQTDDLNINRYDLQSLVKKAVKKYALLFIHKKIAVELSPFDMQALTDEKWFLVLLEQILSNAIKYTEKGSVRILIQDGTVLAIADSGVGIPKEDLPRVFDKGFTGHNGRVDQRATGIGLYLASEVAKRLGHRLSIQSEVGRGTTVLIDVSDIPLEIY